MGKKCKERKRTLTWAQYMSTKFRLGHKKDKKIKSKN
jgi:hypothetical protein